MELMGVIVGLEALKNENSNVEIFSDSRYVVDSVEKGWVFDWEKKSFKKKKNPDLWLRFLKIYRKHNVKFHWIKGHSLIKENEICDQLAVKAAMGKNLPEDTGYTPEIEDEQEVLFH